MEPRHVRPHHSRIERVHRLPTQRSKAPAAQFRRLVLVLELRPGSVSWCRAILLRQYHAERAARQSLFISSCGFRAFSKCHQNLDLRCVFLSDRCCVPNQTTSRIKHRRIQPPFNLLLWFQAAHQAAGRGWGKLYTGWGQQRRVLRRNRRCGGRRPDPQDR